VNAEQYLTEALGGNMNISTLKPLAWHEIMDGYARHKLAEANSQAHNSAVVQLLCDVKGLLLNNDTPSREARAEIIGAINAVLAQQHQ
jgi:hypothetical protein